MKFSNNDKILVATIIILTFLSVIIYLTAVNYSINKLLISVTFIMTILTQVYVYSTYFGANKLTWESREIDQNIYVQTFRSIENKIDLPLVFIVSKKYVFIYFWLFLGSLSCVGSSRSLVGRTSPKFRPNPPQ